MPIKFVGRTTDFKGKPLWEILANLKNHGVGRLVIRNRFQRYPEPCYMKILKVSAMPLPEKQYEDRKVMVLVEKVFRGLKASKPVQLDSVTYKADYELIPKDKEHLYLKSTAIQPKRILPTTIDLPPLFIQILMQQMKAKGVTEFEKPKLTIKYNLETMELKRYKIVEDAETPTMEMTFGVDKSSILYPKSEVTTSS